MITLYDTDNEINVRTSNILNNCENYELVWIDVNNPTEEEFNILRESYDLHSLALEHITNRVKGTKLISYDECSFMILSSINYNISSKNLNFKPVYIFISNKYIITIRYEENHLITKLKNIIKGNRDIFSKGTDFILYSLINEIIKEYFLIADKFEENIDIIQDKLMKSVEKNLLNEIMDFKKKVLKTRKKIYPLREIISNLSRNKYSFISEDNKFYFLDELDHLMLVNDILDNNKDMIMTLLELYSSQLSNKTNDVMKFLTIVTTIMMPITIFSGIYGMNFQFMPELSYKYSYLIFWIVIILTVIIQLMIFRKKKWL